MTDWATTTAKAIRARLAEAKKNGFLDPRWITSVRVEKASLMLAVTVRVNVDPDTMRADGEWTQAARDLATTMWSLIGEYAEQADGRVRFLNLKVGGGYTLPRFDDPALVVNPDGPTIDDEAVVRVINALQGRGFEVVYFALPHVGLDYIGGEWLIFRPNLPETVVLTGSPAGVAAHFGLGVER